MALLGIMLIAGTLRMGWPGISEFKADEARLLAISLDAAAGVSFPLRGITSSVGIPNFPMSAWLYALPVLFWKHPYAATIFTGLLNMLSVVGCWWLTRRYWGREAGLAAALLYATAPWAVIYSRKVWAQDLLPLFVVGWAATGLLAFAENKRRALAAHIVLLAVAMQIHFSAFALVPVTLASGVVFWRRISVRALLVGAALALTTMIPYAVALLKSSGGLALIAGSIGAFSSGQVVDAARFAWQLTTGSNLHSLTGSAAFREYLAGAPRLVLVRVFVGATSLAGILLLARRAFVRTRTARLNSGVEGVVAGRGVAAAGIVLWVIAPIAVFSVGVTAVFPHYFIVIYPAQYIAAGSAVGVLLGQLQSPGRRAAVWGALVIIAGLQAWAVSDLMQFVDTHATPGGFGTPLHLQLEAFDQAIEPLESGAAWEVLVVGPGDDPNVAEFPAVAETLLREWPHRFVDGRMSAVRPLGPTSVLVAPDATHAASQYAKWALSRADVALRSGEGSLTVYFLPPRDTREPLAIRVAESHQLGNGATLLGYEREQSGSTGWAVYWQAGAPRPGEFHMFNHLLNDTGISLAQQDVALFPADQWRAGDLVLSFFDAGPLAGVAISKLRVGMYAYPSIENVQVLDEMGNPAGEFVEFEWAAD
ncbi:MAG: glycosyltransferase family 39 protein [Anaerolineales bacterium]